MPPVYRMAVGMVLNTSYEQAAEEIPQDMNPAEYVINGPDYGGLMSRRYGVRNTGRAAAIVDGDSNISGSYQGERPVENVFEMLDAR
ncbi:MAG TPA: hypothetical protein VFJ72_00790 [Rubrobacteraceae bacterium]|nr:hypothetical protein [Rubrobacteraceae bacterium]